MFKFVAFAIWVYLACLIPLRKPSHSMTDAEKICLAFENIIFSTIWYIANLIYVISYWTNFVKFASVGLSIERIFTTAVSLIITLYLGLNAIFIIDEGARSPDCYFPQMIEDFFKNCRNRDLEKFSYKFVKQFYIFHPKSFRLSIYNFFVCSFIYKDKKTCLPKEGLFRMSVIDYIRFVLFVKHCQEKEERKIDKNKEMKEAMISLLEEDRKQIAEDEALAREEFLAARKDNGVIAARLTGQ